MKAIAWVVAGALSLPLTAAAELPSERQRALDAFVERFVDLAMFDGTVLIDIGGEIVYERSFGLANYEHGVRHDPSTRFRVASVSKNLTDVAFARLIAQGKLSMDTPLARYLPDFPSAASITIGHLLNHSSGIPHSNGLPWGDAKTSLSLDEIVALLAAEPFDFEPGSDRGYSNGGYAVAAKVLEIVGGGSFDEVMRATVFEPLRMSDTAHIADARAVIPRMATGYEPGAFPRQRRHTRFYAVETRPGGGSKYSTARDLHTFLDGVFRRDFVTPELRRSVLGEDDEPFLAQGRSPGFVAKALHDRQRDLIVVSLSNNYSVPTGWAMALADLATGRVDSIPWARFELAAPTVEADDPRLGRYRRSYSNDEVEILRGDRGQMYLPDPANELVTGLVPLSDGSFLLPIYFQRCRQEAATRKITCGMLSGDERYTSEYEALP